MVNMKKSIVIASLFVLLAGCDSESDEEIEIQEGQQVDDSEEQEAAGEDITDETEEANQDAGQENEAVSIPDPVVIEEELWHFDQGSAYDLRTEVGPIIIEGDYAILPVFVDSDDEVEPFFRDIFHGGFVSEDPISEIDIRLIDGQNRTASHQAVLNYDSIYADGLSRQVLGTFLGEGSMNDRMSMGPDNDPVRYFAVFDAPASEQVHILFRSIGMAENVPVINREEAEIPSLAEAGEELGSAEETIEERFAQGIPTVEEIIERELTQSQFEELADTYGENIQARTMSLERYREGLETSVNQIDEIEHSTLLLSGDVLFEFDSADLTDEADAELEAVLDELNNAEGGELEIVGHTDDEHTEEYNQELSEDRAQSVYDRLQEMAELDQFADIIIRGESFREPIADNDSEEGRAQNRRVEIHFTPPTEVVEREVESTELPEALGVEAEFPNAATVEGGAVEILSLRQVDDLFVGRIKVETYDGNLDSNVLRTYGQSATSLSGARGWHNQDSIGFRGSTIYNITLLHGGQRYFPVDYYLEPLPGSVGEGELEDEEDIEFIVPLAERFLPSSSDLTNDEGAFYTATVVWPAVSADQVVIELGLPSIRVTTGEDIESDVESVQPWRITEIPVENGNSD